MVKLKKILEAGYSKNPKKQASELAKDGFIYDPNLSNEYHQTYYNPTTGKMIFNVNGTNMYDPRDLLTDVYLAAGDLKSTTRYKEAEKAYHDAKNFYHPKNTILSGHSLGGSIASLLPTDKATDKITVLDKGSTIGTETRGNETAYRTEGDPISALTANAKHSVTLENPNKESFGLGVVKYIANTINPLFGTLIDMYNAHNVDNLDKNIDA